MNVSVELLLAGSILPEGDSSLNDFSFESSVNLKVNKSGARPVLDQMSEPFMVNWTQFFVMFVYRHTTNTFRLGSYESTINRTLVCCPKFLFSFWLLWVKTGKYLKL